MLSELRTEITALIRERNAYDRHEVSRVFFVSVTPALLGIKDWLSGQYPVAGLNLDLFYPWISVRDDIEQFEKDFGVAIENSFNADMIQDVTLDGVEINSTVNQVVMIADLSEEGVDEKISACVERINKALANMVRKGIFYITGIFIMPKKGAERCSAGKNENPDGHSGSAGVKKRVTSNIDERIAQRSFHRVFIIDEANTFGACLTSDEDLHCLIGQLFYFMTRYPICLDNPNDYVEWLLRNRADNGYVSGFSAFSIVLPLDRIAETIAVYRGAEIIKSSLLEGKGLNFDKSYFNNFLHKNHISELDTVGKSLMESQGYPIRHPVDDLPDFDNMREEDYIGTMNALDASLPAVAKENGSMMEKMSGQLLKDWEFSLETHLESIIAREKGGMKLAKDFLESIKAYLRKIIPEKIAPASYGDPLPVLNRLQNIIAQRPSDEAVYGRSVILSLALIVAALFYLTSIAGKATALALSPLTGLLIGFFTLHSSREKVRRELITFENLVREKWKALMKSVMERKAKECLSGLLEMVERFDAELDVAITRTGEVIDYFQNTYVPPESGDFALWKYLIREREDLLQYKDRYQCDTARVVDDYMKKEVPIHLWRRFAPQGAAEPNAWECHLMEEAARCALPYLSEIMKIDIKTFLEEDRDHTESVKRAMIQGGQPFISIRPEAGQPAKYSVLEIGGHDAGAAVSDIKEGLLQYFNFVDEMPSDVHYRISFFGFHEGIKTEDIIAE